MREVEGESGRDKRRRGGERKEMERKREVVERRKKEMLRWVKEGEGERGTKLSREQQSLPGGPRRMIILRLPGRCPALHNLSGWLQRRKGFL